MHDISPKLANLMQSKLPRPGQQPPPKDKRQNIMPKWNNSPPYLNFVIKRSIIISTLKILSIV